MTLDEALAMVETRLHRAFHDTRNKWNIDLHRNTNGNWTATAERGWDNKRIVGFDGLGPSFEDGPRAAVVHLLSKLEQE